jgi:flagellar motor protein MotB
MPEDGTHMRRPVRTAAGLVAAAFLLASCSYVPSIPDWANPVGWYGGVFGDSDAAPSETAAATQGDEDDDQAFPRLSTVPERPATTAGENEQVAQGLVADRENARYTDDIVRSDAGPRQVAPAPRTQVAALPPAEETAPPPAPPVRSTLDNDIDSRRTITTSRVGGPRPPAAPQAVPPVVPQSIIRREAQQAAPMPVQPAPLRAVASQARAPLAAGGDQVAVVYARLLADSAATVTTAPANAAFQATAAAPIGVESPIAPIIRDTYNAALAATNRTTGAAALADSAPTVIKFVNGSSRIARRYRPALQAIVEQQRNRGGRILVIGHASSRTRNLPLAEHNLVNFRIAFDRTQAVAAELLRLGAQPGLVFAESRGDTEPVFFEAMPQGEAENRRVEVFLVF